MIAIINYGMGNLRSVQKAFEQAGEDAEIVDNPADLEKATKLILPGVGAFPKGMQNLHERGLVEVMNKKVLEEKTPILGICLGMQLLGSFSLEHEKTPGLGYLDMEIRFLEEAISERVPHVGWNDIEFKDCDLLKGLQPNPSFYFVHSLYAVPTDPDIEIGTAHYGVNICSVVKKDNIYATQFHPEKSQKSGMQIIRNFCAI